MAARKRDRLTPKQVAFAKNYVLDWNGTQAAIRAGYSPLSAARHAAQLRKNPLVSALIADLTKEQIGGIETSPAEVVKEIVHLAMDRSGETSQATKWKALQWLASYMGITPQTPRGTMRGVIDAKPQKTKSKGGPVLTHDCANPHTPSDATESLIIEPAPDP